MSLASSLLTNLNKKATGSKAYLQGDHAENTWGLEIPSLAFQWLIGGSNVIPLQRYLGISGAEKSYKSTLAIELGNWFILGGGTHVHLDTENKTNPGMLHGMTWWNDVDSDERIYKCCRSISEWQDMVTTVVESTRGKEQAKGEREPILVTVDSLVGKSTDDADESLRKEGHAPERTYPVAASQVTNYLEALNLLGTQIAVSWTQHMKKSVDQPKYGPVDYREKGASAAQFACSTHLRVTKGSPIACAGHDSSAFPDGGTIQGYEVWIKTARSCVGPDNRSIMVPLLWQYPETESGEHRQAMWFDWPGALGQLLCSMKYSKKFQPKLFEKDKKALSEALHFVETSKRVKCDELGLSKASYHEFGKAIEQDEEIRARISRFLNISRFPSVQEADIDFSAGELPGKDT